MHAGAYRESCLMTPKTLPPKQNKKKMHFSKKKEKEKEGKKRTEGLTVPRALLLKTRLY